MIWTIRTLRFYGSKSHSSSFGAIIPATAAIAREIRPAGTFFVNSITTPKIPKPRPSSPISNLITYQIPGKTNVNSIGIAIMLPKIIKTHFILRGPFYEFYLGGCRGQTRTDV